MQARANTSWRSERPRLPARGARAIFVGLRWRNCGASAEQKELATEQTQFYRTLTDSYKTTFPEQQSILANLTSEFTPILQAGPNQEGFSPAQTAALRTEARDTTAAGAQNLDVALGAREAAMGDASIPSGAKLQLESSLLDSANKQNAGLQNKITNDDYTVGRENFLEAAGALGGVANEQNPIGFGSVATGAGSAANTTENDIAKENSAWMGPVFGLLGGLGGAAIGKA